MDEKKGAAAAAEPKPVGATEPVEGFEPKIIAFCCYYCAYSAADLAGSMRLQYPANVRVIELPCSGKTDPMLLLEAFENGADGVYVAGCMEGDCHFLKGNFRAKKRVNAIKKLLDQVGIGGQRLEMFNLSGSMGPRFAEIAREMTERIKKLGPSPINVRRGTIHKAPKFEAAAAGQGGEHK
ncbi:MAG TPA: hydrogenase iron-sulfur subunit [Bacillota bacterium]|jgi:coenzyme F420-reducing hydrogenase delta subunit